MYTANKHENQKIVQRDVGEVRDEVPAKKGPKRFRQAELRLLCQRASWRAGASDRLGASGRAGTSGRTGRWNGSSKWVIADSKDSSCGPPEAAAVAALNNYVTSNPKPNSAKTNKKNPIKNPTTKLETSSAETNEKVPIVFFEQLTKNVFLGLETQTGLAWKFAPELVRRALEGVRNSPVKSFCGEQNQREARAASDLLVRLAAILLPANGCLILPLAEEAAPHDSQSLLGVPPNAEGSAEAEKRPAEAQANKFDGAKLLHPLIETLAGCGLCTKPLPVLKADVAALCGARPSLLRQLEAIRVLAHTVGWSRRSEATSTATVTATTSPNIKSNQHPPSASRRATSLFPRPSGPADGKTACSFADPALDLTANAAPATHARTDTEPGRGAGEPESDADATSANCEPEDGDRATDATDATDADDSADPDEGLCGELCVAPLLAAWRALLQSATQPTEAPRLLEAVGLDTASAIKRGMDNAAFACDVPPGALSALVADLRAWLRRTGERRGCHQRQL